MGKKILIVGSVAAGPKTACHLKRLMPDAEITMFDMDNYISYGGCGIPYYVSGDVSDEKELRNTSFHMTRDESFFARAKGVNVRTRTEVLSIDRQAKTIEVVDLETNQEETVAYDKLVLSTGTRPNILPIPGADLPGVYTATDLHKAIAIKDQLATGKVGKAVVIGGGAIGVEMAEAFADLWGVETTLVEFMPQLLPNILDRHFSAMLIKHMQEHGVTIHTGEAAKSIEAGDNGRVCLVKTASYEIETDIVVMAAGVRPRSDLARDADLLVSNMGGIIVNNRLQTSDPDIYAAGDCIETCHLITGKKSFAPMGSLANRQGRIVADNLAGVQSTFDGWIGTFILKAFEVCVGATGLTLEAALAEGFAADSVLTAQSDRAHFFPTQAVIPLQMVFDKSNRRVLGVQGFGPMNDAVLARINAAAGLITQGGTIDDFSKLEMAYAPPFATALDALNATANAADNKAAGRLRYVSIDDFSAWMTDPSFNKDWIALDIRHPNETEIFMKNFGERWISIPYIEIRERYKELPKDKEILLICDAGTRSFEIQVFLDHVGLNSLVLGGGFNCIRRMGVDWWPEKS